MKVSAAIEALKALPQDRELMCQVVATDGTVWNCLYEFNNVPQSDSLCQLRVSHPELKTLNAAARPEVDAPTTDVAEMLQKHRIKSRWHRRAHSIAARILDREWLSAGDRRAALVADIAFEIREEVEALEALPSPPLAHIDHPLRHWDRTCPACIAEGKR